MNHKVYNSPGLLHVDPQELRISGSVLLDLMQAVLAKGYPFRFKALGQSMIPFVRDGDLITVSPANISELRRGSIVAFIHPANGKLIVHRIIEITPNLLCIKGDNNQLTLDGWIPTRNILGCVTRIDRKGQNVRLSLGFERYIIAWLSRRGWLYPLRVLVARWRGRGGK